MLIKLQGCLAAEFQNMNVFHNQPLTGFAMVHPSFREFLPLKNKYILLVLLIVNDKFLKGKNRYFTLIHNKRAAEGLGFFHSAGISEVK
jgi:hypothetical protein